ncbi:MAG: MBL fold metallo-hydrolase [Candidatus Woesearchaeota archaeon]
MKLIFHGGAREVGRSCIELDTGSERILMDVGIKFSEKGLVLPENVNNLESVDGVLLSHAHLDHSGGLPLFEHDNLGATIFCTRQTFAITKLMLKDSYKVARIRNFHPAYDNTDLKKVSDNTKIVSYDKYYKLKNLKFKFFNAGHIPGSSMILVEGYGKRILYTADFNANKTNLLFKPVHHEELKDLDVLISESTYGYRDLPNRDDLETEFLDDIESAIKAGGSVLIPVFSVGKAQDILITLSKRDFGVPIYSEGLCNKVTRKILSNKSHYVDNKEVLSDMFYNKIHWISSEKKRKDALKKQGIFISTSGMLQGGPVLSYLKDLWHSSKNFVALTGFQCKRTNGRHLLDDGYVYIDGWRTYVKCKVKKYDFSGHTDRKGIEKLVKFLKPKKVFFQHGDKSSVESMDKWAKKKGFESFSPRVGDKYDL